MLPPAHLPLLIPPSDAPTATRWRTPRILLGLVLLIYGPMVLWHSASLFGIGGWNLCGCELFVIGPVFGLAALVVGAPLRYLLGRPRMTREQVLVAATLLLGFLPMIWLAAHARMLGFTWAGERAAPLIAAIERHVAATGRPPARLQDLVPTWLDELPIGVPELRLVTTGERYGNAWMLTASTPIGLMNFDEFCYLPNQNYPAHDPAGWWQLLGRWGYLHE